MPPETQTNYEIGRVEAVENEASVDTPSGPMYIQTIRVRRPSGETSLVEIGNEWQPVASQQRLSPGQSIVLAQSESEQPLSFADHYRLPVLIGLALAFFFLVAVVARRQGVMSILGMVLSLSVLVFIIIPQILAGGSPLLLALLGASFIGAATIYLSHGWNTRSHIALGSILLTMLVVVLLSHGAVVGANLSGFGSEEAIFLQFLGSGQVNLQGLLLGGIMLGALGVLDDIAVSQVAVTFELAGAKPHIKFAELFKRSYTVGKTHVASLVNTLVLAYAGANLPLFLLLLDNPHQPAWVALNSEVIAEEVVRTLVGSMGLVLAVPLTTALACFVCLQLPNLITSTNNTASHTHRH